ncbi:MAG: DUF2760 domain-containing protein [Kofleriaceae bacterium]|nr:DUF2760 domain-containing protein [Kofleriaceae bacterium]
MAFSCFFKLLFSGKLPASAAQFLPQTVKALDAPSSAGATNVQPVATSEPTLDLKNASVGRAASGAGVDKTEKTKTNSVGHQRDGALAMLALLQREGRLIDFLREPLDSFTDADIGAAARDVHRGCRKVLDQHLTMEAVMPGAEEDRVTVPKGFDPAEIRLIGEARGEAPYKGTLRHHGWRVTDAKLPTLVEGIDRSVVAPAEVEVGQ